MSASENAPVSALERQVPFLPDTVDWTIIGDSKELNVHGSHLGPRCYPVAIRMIQDGLLPMDEIVTHRLPLSDYQKGIDLVISGLTSVKVTIEP